VSAAAGEAGRTAAQPASAADLFFTFNRLALQGFGGVLAVAQRELVERKQWLSREQFVEMLALSQVLPGPNVVNLALMLGDRATASSACAGRPPRSAACCSCRSSSSSP
jgi:chromate transporter